MVLWLSNSENDNKGVDEIDWIMTVVIDKADIQTGNMPVEGEIKEFGKLLEQAEESNQPIPQPAEPEPEEVEQTDDELPATEAKFI